MPSRSAEPSGSTSADAGAARRVQLQSISEGKALVTLEGRSMRLRPGDTLGGDVVRSISGNRIVLFRTIPGKVATQATVVLTFDGGATPRVRVYSTKDLTVPASPTR
jgi:hypothetical protein